MILICLEGRSGGPAYPLYCNRSASSAGSIAGPAENLETHRNHTLSSDLAALRFRSLPPQQSSRATTSSMWLRHWITSSCALHQLAEAWKAEPIPPSEPDAVVGQMAYLRRQILVTLDEGSATLEDQDKLNNPCQTLSPGQRVGLFSTYTTNKEEGPTSVKPGLLSTAFLASPTGFLPVPPWCVSHPCARSSMLELSLLNDSTLRLIYGFLHNVCHPRT